MWCFNEEQKDGVAEMDGREKWGRSQAQLLSYLGGGHESFNCVVMEVGAYMVPGQAATLGPPTIPPPQQAGLHDLMSDVC